MNARAFTKSKVLYFLLTDHLGSTTRVLKQGSTNLYAEMRYKGWGETRLTSGSLPTSFQYTGQRAEVALGISYFKARWYDTSLGRFLQPDSIVPLASQGVMAHDRYAGMNNNPVRFTDPSGHAVASEDSYKKRSIVQKTAQSAPIASSRRFSPLLGQAPITTSAPALSSLSIQSNHQSTLIQSAPTTPINSFTTGTQLNSSQNNPIGNGDDWCPSAILGGGATIASMLPIEFAIGYGMVLSPVTGPALVVLDAVLLPLEVASLNVTFVGVEYVQQGLDRSCEDIKVDPLPLVHFFFPDFMK